MIEKADVVTNSPTNGYISIYHPLSGSDVKLDGNPSVFGDRFNKNGVFVGGEWNASTQKSRCGRPLKPSQKVRDTSWSRNGWYQSQVDEKSAKDQYTIREMNSII